MIKVKKPKRSVKPIQQNEYKVDTKLQHEVPKVVDQFKKIKPKEVFGSDKVKKSKSKK
tara:strand:- start:364 stop:537 length:174 start_codon:yes stop_codon:yes gene_type:complete